MRPAAPLCAIGLLALAASSPAGPASHYSSPTLSPVPASFTIAFAGDTLLSGRASRLIHARGPGAPLARVRAQLAAADLAVVNLECALTSRGRPFPKQFNFRALPTAARALVEAGVDLVSLANNHTGDYGPQGFLDTLASASAQRLLTVGGGKDAGEAARPVRLVRVGRGWRIAGPNQRAALAVLAFSNLLPAEFYATDRRPGVNPAVPGQVRRQVSRAAAEADCVVVCFHWGKERSSRPNEYQRLLGRIAIAAGASLVVGHHPHVLQGIERYRGGFIVYSLGNFLFPSRGLCRQTAVLWACFREGRVAGLKVTPIVADGAQPNPAAGKEAAAILRRFSGLCSALGSRMEIRGDRGLIAAGYRETVRKP